MISFLSSLQHASTLQESSRHDVRNRLKDWLFLSWDISLQRSETKLVGVWCFSIDVPRLHECRPHDDLLAQYLLPGRTFASAEDRM